VARAQEAQVHHAGQPALLLDRRHAPAEQRLLGAHCDYRVALRDAYQAVNRQEGHELFLFRLIVERYEAEGDGVADVPGGVACLGVYVVAAVDELTQVAIRSFAKVEEDEEVLTVLYVLLDGLVAALHQHVAGAALAVVDEGAVITKMVVVTVLKALAAREQEDVRVIPGRGDPVLSLAPEATMDLHLPVVDRPYGVAMSRPSPIGIQVAEE